MTSRFILKKLVVASTTATTRSVSSSGHLAVPYSRAAYAATGTRGFFSDVFKRFSPRSTTSYHLPQAPKLDKEAPKVASAAQGLKLDHDKVKTSNKIAIKRYHHTLVDQSTNMALYLIAYFYPQMAKYLICVYAAKSCVNWFLEDSLESPDHDSNHQLRERATYTFDMDMDGIYHFIQVYGLGKQDLKVYTYGDVLLLIESFVNAPSGKRLKQYVQLHGLPSFDPNMATGTITEEGELKIFFPYCPKKKEATGDVIFPVKID